MLDRQADEQRAVRDFVEVDEPLDINAAVFEQAQVAFDRFGSLEQAVGSAHHVVGLPEGTDARTIQGNRADALASEIVFGIEVGGRKSGRFAGKRIDVQPVAGVAGKIVKIDIAAPVEHRVACAQAAAKLLLGLLDHVHGKDRADAVGRLIQDPAAVHLDHLAHELPGRNLLAGHRSPIAGVGQAAVLRRHHVRRAVELGAGVLVHDQQVGGVGAGSMLDIGNDDGLMVLLPTGPPLLVRHRNGTGKIDHGILGDGTKLSPRAIGESGEQSDCAAASQ